MLESSARALEKYKGRTAHPPPLPRVMVVEDDQILRPTKELLALRAAKQGRAARRRQRARAWRRALLLMLALCLCAEVTLLAGHADELRELWQGERPVAAPPPPSTAALSPASTASAPETPVSDTAADDDVRPGWGMDLSEGHRAVRRSSAISE